MEAKALHKFALISPQKVRLVADQVRGMPVAQAVTALKFSQKKAGGIVLKVLNSAIANAENNQGADADALRISRIFVDQGPSLKRMMPRAKGRGDRIVKRTSHITVVVAN